MIAIKVSGSTEVRFYEALAGLRSVMNVSQESQSLQRCLGLQSNCLTLTSPSTEWRRAKHGLSIVQFTLCWHFSGQDCHSKTRYGEEKGRITDYGKEHISWIPRRLSEDFITGEGLAYTSDVGVCETQPGTRIQTVTETRSSAP
jgi:hypothetical protein